MSVLWRESYRITLYIHLRLVQNWRFVWEGLQYRSPNLEQTFFTGMGKIDCRAGGDAFFLFCFLPPQGSACSLQRMPAFELLCAVGVWRKR